MEAPSATIITLIEKRLAEIDTSSERLSPHEVMYRDILILHDALQDVVYALKEIRGDK